MLDVLHRDRLALRIHDGAFSAMDLTAVADLLPEYTAADPGAPAPELPVVLDMPGKVADFLRTTDLAPAEPTEGLDPETADEVLADILDATRGRTTLLITHQAAGLAAVDDVVTLDRGRTASLEPAGTFPSAVP
ncbi:hypothetical protein [Streptomyces gossypii]|uniref:hypothetical protein n=1 Tax=Streptomyces gossypii TaxID=2883101 RepID=UPI0035CCEC82